VLLLCFRCLPPLLLSVLATAAAPFILETALHLQGIAIQVEPKGSVGQSLVKKGRR
jgi:hypothetical protein